MKSCKECRIEIEGKDEPPEDWIRFCALHEAAPALLLSVQDLLEIRKHHAHDGEIAKRTLQRAMKALALATGLHNTEPPDASASPYGWEGDSQPGETP